MENEMQANQPENEGVATDDKVEDCISADKEANLCADIIACVPEAYCFNGQKREMGLILVIAWGDLVDQLALQNLGSKLTGCFCFLFQNHEGMFDYQHVIPVHADVARRRKRNWSELEEPHVGEYYVSMIYYFNLMF